MIDVVVIGGGQVGLAASWHLSRRGIEHVVLERGRVAETWRFQRWDSFALNTPNWMNRLPGDDDSIQPRDAFQTRDEVIARFDAYARDHRVPVRVSTEVTAVDPGRTPGTFLVTTSGAGGADVVETRHIIVASGGQGRPRRPAVADGFPTSIHQLHTAGYRSPAALPDGAVLVVGSAQSGVQVAEDLAGAGRTVYLCTSPVGRLRRRLFGRDTLEWLSENGFYDVTEGELPDPRMKTMPIVQISGVGRYGHTVSLQWLAGLGVVLLGRPMEVHGARLTLDGFLGANIAVGDRISAELNGLIERRIRESGATPPAREPDPADDPHPDPSSARAPETLDLDAAGISSVIWATGYAPDFGFLRVPVLDETGDPVHDQGAARVPGIQFVGLRWAVDRKSALFFAADRDSAAAVQRIADARTPGA